MLPGTFVGPIELAGGQTFTLFADPGATLTSHTPGVPVVSIAGAGTQVAIYNLDIANATDTVNVIDVERDSGHPSLELHNVTIENNPGIGVSVGDGELVIDRVTIANNAGGGLDLYGSVHFTVTNLLVVANGHAKSEFGGIRLSADATAQNLLALGTLWNNVADPRMAAGIQCTGRQTVVADTILLSNGASASKTTQAIGPCEWRFNLVFPGAPPDGEGNRGQDPRLMNPTARNFEPAPGSPAIGSADVSIGLPDAATWDRATARRPCQKAIGAFEPAQPAP
jgi:parallel beta helix pectate lyase-like protein